MRGAPAAHRTLRHAAAARRDRAIPQRVAVHARCWPTDAARSTRIVDCGLVKRMTDRGRVAGGRPHRITRRHDLAVPSLPPCSRTSAPRARRSSSSTTARRPRRWRCASTRSPARRSRCRTTARCRASGGCTSRSGSRPGSMRALVTTSSLELGHRHRLGRPRRPGAVARSASRADCSASGAPATRSAPSAAACSCRRFRDDASKRSPSSPRCARATSSRRGRAERARRARAGRRRHRVGGRRVDARLAAARSCGARIRTTG